MDNSITAARSSNEGCIDLDAERQSSFSSMSAYGRPFRLGSTLQAILDLESMVSFFAGELRGFVPCDGIEYINEARGVHVVTGEPRRHRCAYNLKTSDHSLGQMVFTRGKRFSKAELIIIEALLSELFLPLRRALQRRAGPGQENRPPPDSACDTTQSVASLPRGRSPQERSTYALPRVASIPFELSLAPLGLLGETAPARSTPVIDTSHLRLVPKGD